jgi:hypothetical protein
MERSLESVASVYERLEEWERAQELGLGSWSVAELQALLEEGEESEELVYWAGEVLTRLS